MDVQGFVTELARTARQIQRINPNPTECVVAALSDAASALPMQDYAAMMEDLSAGDTAGLIRFTQEVAAMLDSLPVAISTKRPDSAMERVNLEVGNEGVLEIDGQAFKFDLLDWQPIGYGHEWLGEGRLWACSILGDSNAQVGAFGL